jgi:hypothetical protein
MFYFFYRDFLSFSWVCVDLRAKLILHCDPNSWETRCNFLDVPLFSFYRDFLRLLLRVWTWASFIFAQVIQILEKHIAI